MTLPMKNLICTAVIAMIARKASESASTEPELRSISQAAPKCGAGK